MSKSHFCTPWCFVFLSYLISYPCPRTSNMFKSRAYNLMCGILKSQSPVVSMNHAAKIIWLDINVSSTNYFWKVIQQKQNNLWFFFFFFCIWNFFCLLTNHSFSNQDNPTFVYHTYMYQIRIICHVKTKVKS